MFSGFRVRKWLWRGWKKLPHGRKLLFSILLYCILLYTLVCSAFNWESNTENYFLSCLSSLDQIIWPTSGKTKHISYHFLFLFLAHATFLDINLLHFTCFTHRIFWEHICVYKAAFKMPSRWHFNKFQDVGTHRNKMLITPRSGVGFPCIRSLWPPSGIKKRWVWLSGIVKHWIWFICK